MDVRDGVGDFVLGVVEGVTRSDGFGKGVVGVSITFRVGEAVIGFDVTDTVVRVAVIRVDAGYGEDEVVMVVAIRNGVVGSVV